MRKLLTARQAEEAFKAAGLSKTTLYRCVNTGQIERILPEGRQRDAMYPEDQVIAAIDISSKRKYTQNLKVLDEWSPELAYILGLALTDGNINKLLTRVSFYSSDVQMLEVVKRLFESTRPIVEHSRPGIEFLDKRSGKTFAGKKQMYGFYIDSKQAVKRFCELGVTPNKSYDGEYPIVPKDVWWHFFRGILDGDGNIYFNKDGTRREGLVVTIAGNRNVVLGLQTDLLEYFSIRSRVRYLEEDRVKTLVPYGGEDTERLLTLTYQNSENLRLERKYNQWLYWNEHTKLVRLCLLCDTPIRAPNNQKLCPSCSRVRYRLMNRRNDHYKRNGVWLPLRNLCKPEESHLHIENLDRYLE